MPVLDINRLAKTTLPGGDDLLIVAPEEGVSDPSTAEAAADTAAAANPPLLMRMTDLPRVLFGDYDASLPFTAENAWSVPDENPVLRAWREAETGTLTTLTEAQFSAHSTIRGEAAIRLGQTGAANPIDYRLRILHGSDILHTIHFGAEANNERPLSFLVYLPETSANRVITWRLDFRGVSFANGDLLFSNVVAHVGSGLASHEVRAEVQDEIASLSARLAAVEASSWRPVEIGRGNVNVATANLWAAPAGGITIPDEADWFLVSFGHDPSNIRVVPTSRIVEAAVWRNLSPTTVGGLRSSGNSIDLASATGGSVFYVGRTASNEVLFTTTGPQYDATPLIIYRL